MIDMYGYYSPYQGNIANFNQVQNQTQMFANTNTDNRIWVQNETAAESYPVAPNSFVRMWDASQPVFYEKRADATGRPLPVECFEYKRKTNQNEEKSTDAITSLWNDIHSLNQRISALEERGRKDVSESNADDSTV